MKKTPVLLQNKLSVLRKRVETKKKIKLTLKVLVKKTGQLKHALLCKDSACELNMCMRYKPILLHYKTCQRKIAGKCSECLKLGSLLRFHAQYCCQDDCPVPMCLSLKKKIGDKVS